MGARRERQLADGFVHYPAGPPYIATEDMHQIALHWNSLLPGVYERYIYWRKCFAFSIAAAHLSALSVD
jgi:hypothetical protein